MIKDYEVDELDALSTRKVQIDEERSRLRHPFEIDAIRYRKNLDIYSNLQPNQFLLMNLPLNITANSLTELFTSLVRNIYIVDLKLTNSLYEDGKSDKVAYATVTLESGKEAKKLKDKLKNYWIEDRLVKVKTKDDQIHEQYDNRTIVFKNIPKEYKKSELIKLCSTHGSIVGIELPTKNAFLEDASYKYKSELDHFTQEKKDKNDIDYRRSSLLIKDRLNTDKDYVDFLAQVIGEDRTQSMIARYNSMKFEQGSINNILDSERYRRLSSMITQLQFENKEVENHQELLRQLQEQLQQQETNNIPTITTESDNFENLLSQKKDQVTKVIKYLDLNRQSLNEYQQQSLDSILNKQESKQQQQDPIQQLQILSRQELSKAYDLLVNLLDQRSKLIEDRIKEQINFIPANDRVLFEQKLFSKEFEDFPDQNDVFNVETKIEDILSINEQVNNAFNGRETNAEQRFFDIVSGKFDPFVDKSNFNPKQLAYAKTRELDDERFTKIPPFTIYQSQLANSLYMNKPFKQEALQEIEQKVNQLKKETDTPFDELYHREKNLIQEVILAEKLLREKEKSLPNPIGDKLINVKEIMEKSGEIFRYGLDPYLETEHQFVRDKKKENERLLKAQLEDATSTSQSFDISSTFNQYEQMLDDGSLSQKDFDLMKKMYIQSNEHNLGYAFVTYSHTDEARKALVTHQHCFVDGIFVEASLKGKLDHSDMDKTFKINQQRNDANLIQELENMRNKSKELREFELKKDKDMPQMRKIKEFRRKAQELLTQEKYKTREDDTLRTLQDEEKTKEKLREVQKQNPHLDLTQLFQTEKAEQAKQALHKKAYASYKAFEFLKNGLDFQKKTLKKKMEEEAEKDPIQKKFDQLNDPYNFPPVEQTVARLLTKDSYPRVLDAGDKWNKPGRKFNYSEQDFIEMYTGKDNARISFNENVQLTDDYSTAFSFNEDMKRKYPLENYLKTPELEAKKKKLEELADIHGPEVREFQEKYDMEDIMKRIQPDYPHPTDANRTFFTDLNRRIEGHFKSQEQKGLGHIFDTDEINRIKKSLRKEYFPKPVNQFKNQRFRNRRQQQTKVKALDPNAPVDLGKDEKFETNYDEEEVNEIQKQMSSKQKKHESAENTMNTLKVRKLNGANPNLNKPDILDEEGLLEQDEAAIDPLPIDEKEIQQQALKTLKKEISFFYDQQEKKKDEVDPKLYKYLDHQKTKIEGNAKIGEEEASQDVKDENRDFIYDMKYKKKRNIPIEFTKTMETHQKVAQQNNIQLEDLYEEAKDSNNISTNNYITEGIYTKQNKVGLDKKKGDDIKTRERQVAQNLDEYIHEQQKEEEEDSESLISKYYKQMNQQKIAKAKELKKLREMKDKLKDQIPETPSLKEYFDSQSKNKHPFEEEKYQYNAEDIENDDAKYENDVNADEFEEELMQRELEGRLMGEKLSPRQFAILYHQQKDDVNHIKYVKNTERETYLSGRDYIRLVEERLEQIRIQKVQSGEWREHESHLKLKQLIKEVNSRILSPKEEAKKMQEFEKMVQQYKMLDNPDRMFEQEYHFDEGLGQSLADHVKELKDKMPGLEVQIRRDRDGFAIVKTLMKPKYKYDLDKFLNTDLKEVKELEKSTMELILSSLIQKGSGGKQLKEFSKQDFEQLLEQFAEAHSQNKNQSLAYDIDQNSKQAFEQLLQERVYGKYKQDNEGFLKAFNEIQDKVVFDKNKPLTSGSLLNIKDINDRKEQVLEELYSERVQMSNEIYQQLSKRMKQFMFLKERKDTDFVKFRKNEIDIFNDQVKSQENRIGKLHEDSAKIQSKYGGQEDEIAGFDKVRYLEMRREIKMRKEAKARILKQGYPDLKPYAII